MKLAARLFGWFGSLLLVAVLSIFLSSCGRTKNSSIPQQSAEPAAQESAEPGAQESAEMNNEMSMPTPNSAGNRRVEKNITRLRRDTSCGVGEKGLGPEVRRMLVCIFAQALQYVLFNLPDAFAREVELAARLLERMRLSIRYAVAIPNNALFALG